MSSGPIPQVKLSKSQREAKQRDDFFATITAENAQLKRTLWLVLHTLGSPTVSLDTVKMSPLWDLRFTGSEDAPTKLTLHAELLPEATEDQLNALYKLLVGTPKSIRACIEEVGLPNHPVGYLQAKLMTLSPLVGQDARRPLVWKDDKWVDDPRSVILTPGTTPS